MTKLLCIKDGYMDTGEQFCTRGKTYNVVNESDKYFTVATDIDTSHLFHKNSVDGEGVWTWFTLSCESELDNVQQHRSILDTIHESYKRKNHDYGDSFHKSFERFGLISPVVRMSDKMGRLETLCQKEARVKEESIRDTLMDLANYCIMTVMELDNTKSTEVSDES